MPFFSIFYLPQKFILNLISITFFDPFFYYSQQTSLEIQKKSPRVCTVFFVDKASHYTLWNILKTWARMAAKLHGCFSTKSKYSLPMSQTLGFWPENSAGLYKFGSATIIPSQPVSDKHRSTSLKQSILPLAKTGIFKASFIALMCFQLARPVNGPFCSRVLPCTVSKEIPVLSIIRAYLTDLSMSSKTRILAVTGIFKPLTAVDKIEWISSHSSCKKDP